jgi:hypothetical protein
MAAGEPVTYCPRCGWRDLDDPDLCSSCFDGVADEERAAAIVAAAGAGSREARVMLAKLSDPRALGPVLDATADRRTVLQALEASARIGDPVAIDVARGCLDDPDPAVREAALAALADLGPIAADAIATRLDAPEDREAAAMALAWLRDERAIAPLVDIVTSDPLVRLAYRGGNIYRSPYAALTWLEDPSAWAALDTLADRIAAETSDGPPGATANLGLLAWSVLEGRTDPRAATLRTRLAKAAGLPGYGSSSAPRMAPEDARRTVPRWSITLRRVRAPVDTPVTKVGGQPLWRGTPAWPRATDGGPMTFCAQVAVPWAERTAYLFVDPVPDFEVEPLVFGALVSRPGQIDVPVGPWSTGPSAVTEMDDRSRFILRRHDLPVESLVDLEPGFDPRDWDQHALDPVETDIRDWNKVGGMPLWLQAAGGSCSSSRRRGWGSSSPTPPRSTASSTRTGAAGSSSRATEVVATSPPGCGTLRRWTTIATWMRRRTSRSTTPTRSRAALRRGRSQTSRWTIGSRRCSRSSTA